MNDGIKTEEVQFVLRNHGYQGHRTPQMIYEQFVRPDEDRILRVMRTYRNPHDRLDSLYDDIETVLIEAGVISNPKIFCPPEYEGEEDE